MYKWRNDRVEKTSRHQSRQEKRNPDSRPRRCYDCLLNVYFNKAPFSFSWHIALLSIWYIIEYFSLWIFYPVQYGIETCILGLRTLVFCCVLPIPLCIDNRRRNRFWGLLSHYSTSHNKKGKNNFPLFWKECKRNAWSWYTLVFFILIFLIVICISMSLWLL